MGKKRAASLRNRRAKSKEQQLYVVKSVLFVCLQRDKQDIRRLYVRAYVCMRRWSRLLAEKSTSGIFYAFPIRHIHIYVRRLRVCVCGCVYFGVFIYLLCFSFVVCRYEWCMHVCMYSPNLYVAVCVRVFTYMTVCMGVCLPFVVLVNFILVSFCMFMHASSIDFDWWVAMWGLPVREFSIRSCVFVSRVPVYVRVLVPSGAKQVREWSSVANVR